MRDARMVAQNRGVSMEKYLEDKEEEYVDYKD